MGFISKIKNFFGINSRYIESTYQEKYEAKEQTSHSYYFFYRSRKGYKVGKIGKYVKKFLRDRCIYGNDYIILGDDLYSSYLKWAKDHNYIFATRIGMPRFIGKDIKTIKMESTRGLSYKGLTLKPEEIQ